MSAEDPQAYILNRDSFDSARLSFQHQCLIANQGYYLHPTILSVIGNSHGSRRAEPIRILDLATGNGIWAIELAEALSKSSFAHPAEILGLDISSRQFPNKLTWPFNVSFDTWDIFTDIPEQYLGRFDVVHVRFIIPILWQDDERPTKVLQQLQRLLKPGGYLQWHEPPPPMIHHVVGFNSDGSCKVSDEPLKFLQVLDKFLPMQSRSTWLNQLGDFVRASGNFVDVDSHWISFKKERMKYEADLLLWNAEASIPNVLKIPGLPAEAKQELGQEREVLSKELEAGTMLVAMRSLVVVAKRV